tara:strand:- start:10972 stop:11499 length:528 start_codon:yes stop_codon:yes gene_type:complete
MIKPQLPSLIEYPIKDTFKTILNFFDPYKNKNRKPKVLDFTNSYYWDDETYKLYDVNKTRNLHGTTKDNKYNIIVYEPPKNKNFDTAIKEHIDQFYNLLNRNGVLIVKVTDFRSKGQIRGSYEVRDLAYSLGFNLNHVIIHKHKLIYAMSEGEGVNIIHSNFMIFTRVCDSDEWY